MHIPDIGLFFGLLINFRLLGQSRGMTELTVGDLLKPLKDALLKNWSTSLAHVLDDFVNRLLQGRIPELNFVEAATVIQNSTYFYCKRLDLVFKLLEELTDNVSTFENCAAADSASAPKRRRLVAVLESDELDVLGFVISDHATELNPAKLKNRPSLLQIVINKDIKAVKKPETAIPLSSAGGVFFGHKEDFRLFGKTWSDGTVNRDYECSTASTSTSLERMDVDPILESGCDDDHHVPDEENGDLRLPDSMPSPCHLDAPTPEEYAQMLSQIKPLSVKLTKLEDCEPITFQFNFNPKALKRRRVFSLPEDLVEEAKVSCAYGEVGDLEPITFNFNFNPKPLKCRRVFSLSKELVEEAKLQVEKNEERRKRAQNRASKLLEAPQVHADDSQDTGYLSDPAPLDVSSPSSGDHPGQNEMRDFKMKRRESAHAAAEVAERVAEWHDRMAPRLQEAEDRKKFDVHQYADVILEKFADDDKSYKPFSKIVAGEPWDEVSRYFLAMLCLANTYNVDIRRNSDAPNDFSVKLLSKVRHHKEMDRQVGNLS